MQLKLSSQVWIYALTVLGVLIGFHLSYGLQVVLPGNINWLMSAYHDWGQYYLGFSYFRAEPWSFPLGVIENFNYPAGTNVGYTDSIPLLALIGKLFSGVLPNTFQYFGGFLLFNHVLTGVYAARLLKLFKVNAGLVVLGAILVAFNPVLFYHGMHPSTTSHWLIIASFFYYLRPADAASAMRTNGKQMVLLLFAGLCNPYMFLFVLGFNVILPLRHVLYDHLLSWKQAIIFMVAPVIAVVVSWFLIGWLTLGNEVSMEVSNAYGLYSTNLNSFVNSFGYSSFIPQLSWVTEHQYEGYAYLGLGAMLLLIAGLASFIYHKAVKKTGIRKDLLPLVLLALVYAAFAFTHRITLGDQVLFEIPIPDVLFKVGSIFRASGRYIWITYYALLLAAVIWFGRIRLSNYLKVSVMALLLVVQFADISFFFKLKNFEPGGYSPAALQDEKWHQLTADCDRVVTYPPFDLNLLYTYDYQDLCYLLLENQKPISTGYVARETTAINQQFIDSLHQSLILGSIPEGDLYLTTAEHLEVFLPLVHQKILQLGYLDGYFYLTPDNRLIREMALDASQQAMVDSTIVALSNFKRWQATAPPQVVEGSIKHNLESCSFQNNVLRVQGWAFADGATNSIGDSTFVTLNGPNGHFRAPLRKEVRADVTSHFGAENLDNAGFERMLFTDHLPAGTYAPGLSIRRATGEWVHTTLPEQQAISIVPALHPSLLAALPEAQENVRCNVETVAQTGNLVEVSGWAINTARHADQCKMQLVCMQDNRVFVTPVEREERTDVTSYFNTGFNYDMAGFRATINLDYFDPGAYTLGVIVSADDVPPGSCMSDQQVIKEF